MKGLLRLICCTAAQLDIRYGYEKGTRKNPDAFIGKKFSPKGL